MLKKTRQIGIVLCVLMLAAGLLILAGCNKAPSLKGTEIIIGNWWAEYDVETYEPENNEEELQLEWRTKIQKDNGFTIKEKMVASWNEMQQTAVNSIMAGSPAASVFVLEPRWAMALITQGLTYPVNEVKSVNLLKPEPVEKGMKSPQWNPNTAKAFTFNKKTLAFSNDVNLSNAQVVFFNKRLFREAGLDPNLPYDMQKAGTWTWDAFLDICKKLTRDVNNDGIIDIYALPAGGSGESVQTIIASNGACFVDKDPETGKFVNATNRPEFLEALQYAITLNNEGVLKPDPPGANWDWYKGEFADGKLVMRIDESYVWNELQNMNDDWGVVLFPKGPRVSDYKVSTRENVLVVPATFSKAEVDQIMWALALWYTPVSDSNWKEGYYNLFSDARAVDETLELIHNMDLHISKNHIFIPGLQIGDICWSAYGSSDPSQLVESVSSNWDNKIEDVNETLFK